MTPSDLQATIAYAQALMDKAENKACQCERCRLARAVVELSERVTAAEAVCEAADPLIEKFTDGWPATPKDVPMSDAYFRAVKAWREKRGMG